ncbi:MAG: hypothetical protein AB7U85_04215 [Alphaproteobacteria bacterium]
MTDIKQQTKAKGIYLETRSVKIQWNNDIFQHSYLVYRDGKGNEKVISGGPGDKSLDGGNLVIENNVDLNKSKDAYGADEKLRKSTKLDIPDNQLEETWQNMQKAADKIAEQSFDYDTFPPSNSNSVVNTICHEAGVKCKLPGGLGNFRTWGFGDDLNEEYNQEQEAKAKEQKRLEDIKTETELKDQMSRAEEELKDKIGTVSLKDIEQKILEAENPENKNIMPLDKEKESKDNAQGTNSKDINIEAKYYVDPASDDISGTATPLSKNPYSVSDIFDLLSKNIDSASKILAKRPEEMTKGEMREAQNFVFDKVFHPKRQAVDDHLKKYFGVRYPGDVEYDDTGKMIDTPSVIKEPQEPSPIKDRFGKSVNDSLKNVAGLIGEADNTTGGKGVKVLQEALNHLSDAQDRREPYQGFKKTPVKALEEDNILGPKTATATFDRLIQDGADGLTSVFSNILKKRRDYFAA